MKKNQDERYMEFEKAYDERLPALAVELGKRYLKKYPRDIAATILYGMSLHLIARYKEALKVFEKALRICANKQKYIIYVEVGEIYRSKGKIKKAAKYYGKAIKNCPHKAGNYIFMGAMYAHFGKFDEAEQCHRKALLCSDGAVDEAYLNLGYVLRAKEKYYEAYDSFKKALELDNNYKQAINALKDLDEVIKLLT